MVAAGALVAAEASDVEKALVADPEVAVLGQDHLDLGDLP